ncbi:Uncharacterised protein [Vibrio cholerae]|nr:Uncharacterised protein [Vibrio cholerae]
MFLQSIDCNPVLLFRCLTRLTHGFIYPHHLELQVVGKGVHPHEHR